MATARPGPLPMGTGPSTFPRPIANVVVTTGGTAAAIAGAAGTADSAD